MNNLSLATKFLHSLEASTSTAMFLRDTGGCLVPKLAASRSVDEARELTFAETAESAVFYFSITPIAMFFSSLFASKLKLKTDKLAKPFEKLFEISNETVKNIKLGKFGKIAATFSILLPLIYAIAPVRNLITLSKSGKEDFISVIELNRKQDKRSEVNKINSIEKARQKSKDLLKKLTAIAASGLAITTGIVALGRNPIVYKKLEPVLNAIIKQFDFKGKAGLTLKQLGFLIMPVSIASYFVASRDKYEVLENARRFLITVPMMFFGQDFIEKKIYRFFDKAWGSTLATSKGLRTYEEIFKMPLKEQAKNLKSKNWAIATAFLINTTAIAAAVAILNRISTRRRYQKEQERLLLQKPYLNPIKQWRNSLKINNIA